MREYDKLKFALDKAILLDEGRGNIILYPYGFMGMLAKRMLNEQYGITERCLVDNKLSQTNPNIKALSDLSREELEESIFVITSDNQSCYDIIRSELRKYVKKEGNIVDVCYKVRMFNSRRVETLRLTAEWMNEMQLPGNVAEFGVCNGDFAKFINQYYPNKKLYLFDTFEGFEHEKLSQQVDDYWGKVMKALNNTFVPRRSIEDVLAEFQIPENCIIKKGYFPDSTEGVEDTFCYVSLDVDTYKGTKDGLEWFWSRMVKRGIIMIHDYNQYECLGVKLAVDEFCDKNEIGIVCLPDDMGSVVLIKQ